MLGHTFIGKVVDKGKHGMLFVRADDSWASPAAKAATFRNESLPVGMFGLSGNALILKHLGSWTGVVDSTAATTVAESCNDARRDDDITSSLVLAIRLRMNSFSNLKFLFFLWSVFSID